MLKTPLLFAIGFLTMFLIGGINGAFSASVPVDFALHDTYWVVAHLHYVLFGGSVFGVMGGFYYWFPKMTGRMMNETVGKAQFVLMFIGFNMTFFPMHELGLMGMPRRIADYSSTAGWNQLNLVATIGGFTIAASMVLFLWNVFMSLRSGQSPATTHGKATRSNGRRPRRRRPITSTISRKYSLLERPVFDARWGEGGRALSTNMSVTAHDDLPVEHNPLASMPHDTHGGISNPVLGMLLFITSEVMFFGGLFAAYFNIRANAAQWPPINPETSEPFHLQVLPVVTVDGVTSYSFVLIATFLLITSSFTCQYAIWKIRSDDRTRFIRAMAVTIALGITFLLMQLTDYAHPRQRGPDPLVRGPSARPSTPSQGSTVRTSSAA